MALVRTFDDLVRALEATATSHRANPQTREIAFPTKSALPGSLMLRFEGGAPFVGVRHLVAEHIPLDRLGELETAIAHTNHQLDVSGFNLDHARAQLYYRISVPLFDGVDSELLNQVARGVVGNAIQFAPAFAAVIAGRRGAEIAEIYKELTTKSS